MGTEHSVNTDAIPKGFLQFAERIKNDTPVELHSMYVVGSVLTPDFNPEGSDVNSLIIPRENSPAFLDFLIAQGREFRDIGVAPPLVMTLGYIEGSLDVFPIEFFNFRAIHHVLFGEDALTTLRIADSHLRLQCEREIKVKLLWLGQVYIEALGDRKILSAKLASSITGYLPLFRAILHLAGRTPPLGHTEVLTNLAGTVGLDIDIFELMYRMKLQGTPLPENQELRSCFSRYYTATEQLARYVDQISC